MKPVGLAELKADPVDGVEKVLRPRIVPERIQDALLMGVRPAVAPAAKRRRSAA